MFSLFTWSAVFSSQESDPSKERNRRNSDSAVYFSQKESDVSAVLSKLQQAEIIFQQEKIESLEKQIMTLKGELEEPKAFTKATKRRIGKESVNNIAVFS